MHSFTSWMSVKVLRYLAPLQTPGWLQRSSAEASTAKAKNNEMSLNILFFRSDQFNLNNSTVTISDQSKHIYTIVQSITLSWKLKDYENMMKFSSAKIN